MLPLNLLGFLASRWRLALAGLAVAGALGFAGYVGHLKRTAEHAKTKAQAAEAQAQTDQAVAQATDTYAQRTIIIRERAQHAVSQLEHAQGADTPIPDDVRKLWLDGMRDGDPPT